MVPIQKFFATERLIMDFLKIHEVFFSFTHHRDLVVFCDRVNIAIQARKLNDTFIEFDDLVKTFSELWPGIVGKYIPLTDVKHCLLGMQLVCIKTEFYMVNYNDLETHLLECISKFRYHKSKQISIGCDLIPMYLGIQDVSYEMLNTKCYGRLTSLHTQNDYQHEFENYILQALSLDQHEYPLDDYQETSTFCFCIIKTNR